MESGGYIYTREDLAAYDKFRSLIVRINIQCAIFERMIRIIAGIFGMQAIGTTVPHLNYYDTRGFLGYRERVVPPVFVISPFFSDRS